MAGLRNKTSNATRVAYLNDQLRINFRGGRVMQTAGVAALPIGVQDDAVALLRTFTAFNADNDPRGEHDLGNFELSGHRFFWKIDYYAPDMEHGSEDPSDPAQTTRVLTLMLAEEY